MLCEVFDAKGARSQLLAQEDYDQQIQVQVGVREVLLESIHRSTVEHS